MPIEPVRLFYKEYGEGPPLVILHGLLGSSGNWHSLSRNVFGERFSVYALDLRNHGRSPHSERFDYAAMVADFDRFCDEHELERPCVLGHSMGGKTAMHAALTQPERISKLVVVDIAPRSYPPSHIPILEALQGIDFSRVERREDVDDQLAESISSAAVRQFLMKNLDYDSDAGTYSWQMALDVIRDNYERINEAVENGRRFEGPALFVRGSESDYIRDEDEADIRTLFPEARIETVEGAGHWIHADSPDAFSRIVIEFLTD